MILKSEGNKIQSTAFIDISLNIPTAEFTLESQSIITNDKFIGTKELPTSRNKEITIPGGGGSSL